MTNWNNPFHGDYAWYNTPEGGAAHLFASDGRFHLRRPLSRIEYTALCGAETKQGQMANPANKITQCAVCFKRQFELERV